MSDDPIIIESIVPRDKYPKLGLCPHCGIPGMTRPYLVKQTRDLGDDNPDDYYLVRCDECEAHGCLCANITGAVWLWNNVSLACLPEQRAGAFFGVARDVKGSPDFESWPQRQATKALLATVYG